MDDADHEQKSDSNRKLKFAIIGCGRISPRHFDAIQNHIPNAEVIACCDASTDKAKTAGKKYDVSWYTNYNEMLEKHPEIDVVTVLTPSGEHAKHTIDIARYGKHVIVEKPMALTLEDAEEMIRATNAAGVRLFVVKQNRYNVPVRKLRDAVDAGRFGKMVMGTVRVRWCRDQKYYDQDPWRGTWMQDGGVITNQASHHIDLLTWMMGEVESVFAYSATRLVNVEVDDTAVAVLKFSSGALGIIEATTATRPKDLEGSISVLGEGGTVEIAGFAVNQMKTWNFVNKLEGDELVLNDFAENPPDVYGFGHIRYLQDVCNAIVDKKHFPVDGLEGLKSLTLINAMYESMETGREVRLRFKPNRAKLGKASRETMIVTMPGTVNREPTRYHEDVPKNLIPTSEKFSAPKDR